MRLRCRAKHWVATRLRFLADRIDRHGAPKRMSSLSFTFELGEGIRVRDDHRGCPLWYFGDDDYNRAHNEADRRAPRIDWRTMTFEEPQGDAT